MVHLHYLRKQRGVVPAWVCECGVSAIMVLGCRVRVSQMGRVMELRSKKNYFLSWKKIQGSIFQLMKNHRDQFLFEICRQHTRISAIRLKITLLLQ